MSGIRDHRLFTITFTRMERHERIEDAMGELITYGGAERGPSRTVNIVAPNTLMAQAWVKARWVRDAVIISAIVSTPIDAFIQEHVR
jgi:hypothetical protein